MWKCKHCKNEFDFDRTCDKANHSRHCDSNPKKLESYKKMAEATKHRFDKKLGEYKDYTVQCHTCDNNITVNEREHQHPLNEQYFCSRSCANSMGGTAKALKYHPDEVAHYTTVAWRHHKKECIVCGFDKIVAVHHMDHNHQNNDPENLIPLCPNHHQMVHSRWKDEVIPHIEEYLGS